jgi:eukaryotic-like serine/threonine-protein kinase
MSSGHPTKLRSERLPTGYVLDGRYEIVRAIGAGGFAYVYEANQLNIERPVAVKVLSPPRTLEDRDHYFQRFVREAKLAAQIRHPNVVTIHDYGVADEHPFIVMELLEGRELKQELRAHGPMDPARALPLFIECLDALGEAHERKIVHKDLKPSNLFLCDPGGRREVLRILDFGVARLQEGESLTQSGRVYGTMRYMAPEYLRKQTVTPSLDVYQMGLILVEALAGKPAIDADDHLVCITAHFLGELEIPEALLEGPLGPVLQKALAVGYTDRYENAHAMRVALEAIDPKDIAKVEKSAPVRLLNDYSGSMEGIVMPPPSLSQALPADTGGHDMPEGPSSRPATRSALAALPRSAAPPAALAPDISDSMSFPADLPSDAFDMEKGPRRMTTLLIGLAGGLLIAALVGAGMLMLLHEPDAGPGPAGAATVNGQAAPKAAEHPTEPAKPAAVDPAAAAPTTPAAVAEPAAAPAGENDEGSDGGDAAKEPAAGPAGADDKAAKAKAKAKAKARAEWRRRNRPKPAKPTPAAPKKAEPKKFVE